MKSGDFIYCEWLDAFSIDDWTPKESSKIKPCLIISVGICIENNPSELVLALNHDTINDNYSCFMVIPKGMIKKLRKLK